MMNDLQVFDYNETAVRVLDMDGEPWWVLKDICTVLEISNPTMVADRLDDDEVTKFNLGGLSGESNIVNESGLYTVILRSDKPEAKKFRRWVTHEVLPAIRKTGSYSVKQVTRQASTGNMTDYQQKMIETREKNAQIRRAQILQNIAAKYQGTTYAAVLDSYTTKELTGEYLLPLPEAEEKTYSASEIGEQLGITANVVGTLTNRHELKTPEYGKLFHDKSRYSNKEVESFRYYETVIPVLKKILKLS